ncbi:MAG: ABC transporter permease [Clostridiales bacterium]|nr:ABC transporter permease [Clostridiales bacterium]
MKESNVATGFWQKVLKVGIISWIVVIAVWWLGSLNYDSYFLPSPYETIQGYYQVITNGMLFTDIVVSVTRFLRGWGLGILFAVPLGLLIGNFKFVRWFVEPITSFFRFVPAIALTTLFLMWFGVGDISKVMLIFYASFFPILVNTIAGVASVDEALTEAASCMGATRIKVFFSVVVPSSVQNIFTGVRLGLSSSIICVISAEMLVGSDGLGYLINSSKLYYRTDWAFAGIVTLALVGFLADRLLSFGGKKALKRFGVKG